MNDAECFFFSKINKFIVTKFTKSHSGCQIYRCVDKAWIGPDPINPCRDPFYNLLSFSELQGLFRSGPIQFLLIPKFTEGVAS